MLILSHSNLLTAATPCQPRLARLALVALAASFNLTIGLAVNPPSSSLSGKGQAFAWFNFTRLR
jgi:hypothetical protein